MVAILATVNEADNVQLVRAEGGVLPVFPMNVTAVGVVSVGATAPITSSGGAAPVIGITPATDLAPGSISAADKTKLDGITAGAAVASVGGTAPIVSSGGTTPALSITAATDVAAGSMSAADKTKLDGLSSAGATPLFVNLGAVDNVTGASGLFDLAGWSFTPQSSGLCEFLVQWQFTVQLVDAPQLQVLIGAGGTVGGGTVTNGIHLAAGSALTFVGVTFSALIGLASADAAVAAPTLFQGSASTSGLIQLTPGTAAQFRARVSEPLAGRNYTGMTVNVFIRELGN
jgi:hypothetical protein